MQKYSTVVFDVGGTLLRLDYDALSQVYVERAATLGYTIDLARARAMLEVLEGEMPTWQKTRAVSLEKDNGMEFWNSFYTEGFQRLGVAGDVSVPVTEIRERFQRAEFETLFDDVMPVLDALAARGTQMGILSNFSDNLENVLRQVGVHHYFKFFVVSAVAGIEKPNPKIFDLIVRAAKQPREQIVYVGDSIFHDIEGARRAGIAGILVDRRNKHRDFVGAKIQDLRELIG